MSTPVTIQRRVEDYLAERRRLGFHLRHGALALASFVRYLERRGPQGPLTVEVRADWARHDKYQRGTPTTWARRLKLLRPFTRYRQQFEPRTEIPDESVFGPLQERLTPHIYREQEIVELLAAARRLPPPGGLRPATYETLFGLLASTGLRISEALALRDVDVDRKLGVLTVRRTKFAKSRLVPLHSSTLEALQRYRRLRNQYVAPRPDTPFFITTEGRRSDQGLADTTTHRVFRSLCRQLGWVDRGAHDGPRIHDLRHTFAVRRLMLWHEHGTDLDQAMLALSTYLGHAKISHTYWYLTGVPELMAVAGGKFERFAQNPGADDD